MSILSQQHNSFGVTDLNFRLASRVNPVMADGNIFEFLHRQTASLRRLQQRLFNQAAGDVVLHLRAQPRQLHDGLAAFHSAQRLRARETYFLRNCAEHFDFTKAGNPKIGDGPRGFAVVALRLAPDHSFLVRGILDGRPRFRRLARRGAERQPPQHRRKNLGLSENGDQLPRSLLPFRSRNSLFQAAAVFEQAFPTGARDFVLGLDFIKHDLRPGAAPGIELYFSLHMDQLRDLFPEFQILRLNFPARARRQAQMDFPQFRADSVRHLIPRKRRNQLPDWKIHMRHRAHGPATLAEQVQHKLSRQRLRRS